MGRNEFFSFRGLLCHLICGSVCCFDCRLRGAVTGGWDCLPSREKSQTIYKCTFAQ